MSIVVARSLPSTGATKVSSAKDAGGLVESKLSGASEDSGGLDVSNGTGRTVGSEESARGGGGSGGAERRST
ncbi:MAG: hypothetical protein HY791_07760 [Deltaproteobacteria bacterium]|nr:hypothetical protein [Deltaproteobacteria bacterium]